METRIYWHFFGQLSLKPVLFLISANGRNSGRKNKVVSFLKKIFALKNLKSSPVDCCSIEELFNFSLGEVILGHIQRTMHSERSYWNSKSHRWGDCLNIDQEGHNSINSKGPKTCKKFHHVRMFSVQHTWFQSSSPIFSIFWCCGWSLLLPMAEWSSPLRPRQQSTAPCPEQVQMTLCPVWLVET